MGTATREEKHPYRVSGLVQHEMEGRSDALLDGDGTGEVYHTSHHNW